MTKGKEDKAILRGTCVVDSEQTGGRSGSIACRTETFKARTDAKIGQGKGKSLRTGNMERVAWTAIEGRQIKSAREGMCVAVREEG